MRAIKEKEHTSRCISGPQPPSPSSGGVERADPSSKPAGVVACNIILQTSPLSCFGSNQGLIKTRSVLCLLYMCIKFSAARPEPHIAVIYKRCPLGHTHSMCEHVPPPAPQAVRYSSYLTVCCSRKTGGCDFILKDEARREACRPTSGTSRHLISFPLPAGK